MYKSMWRYWNHLIGTTGEAEYEVRDNDFYVTSYIMDNIDKTKVTQAYLFFQSSQFLREEVLLLLQIVAHWPPQTNRSMTLTQLLETYKDSSVL